MEVASDWAGRAVRKEGLRDSDREGPWVAGDRKKGGEGQRLGSGIMEAVQALAVGLWVPGRPCP